MNIAESFSANYSEARTKFCEIAASSGGALERFDNPNTGPDGDALSTDVAWFGARTADNVLVLISGTHGVEGFCGSGAQIDWLRRGGAAQLPAGVAALLVHAINPYGFAWLRRVTEENVDLNRNWVDFSKALPTNAGYDQLASAIVPDDWSESGEAQSTLALVAYGATHGAMALQQALSGGQYAHPKGIFFGGTAPTWARRTQEAIYSEYLGQAGRVGLIDFHTGLGPWGHAEIIMADGPGSDAYRRGRDRYGSGVTSLQDGTSVSAALDGEGLSASRRLLPHAEVTGVALEYGTLPGPVVLQGLRADAWLHSHGDPASQQGTGIKAQIRDAFYADTEAWKGMVVGQSLAACKNALVALGGK